MTRKDRQCHHTLMASVGPPPLGNLGKWLLLTIYVDTFDELWPVSSNLFQRGSGDEPRWDVSDVVRRLAVLGIVHIRYVG